MSLLEIDIRGHLGKENQLMKLDKLLNWEKINMEIEDVHGHLGRKGYPVHKMFKILLLQAWHSQSDPGIAASLKVRLDFLRFVGFTLGEKLPDDTTICKFRNKMIKQGKYDKLLKEINNQLEEMGLKIKEAKEAIVDATIIRSAARPNRRYKESQEADKYEKEESKDEDARWLKKGKKCYFGYRCFANVDKEGYINKGYAVPANAAETKEFCRITKDTTERSRVYTDKGFCSKENRINLKNSNKKNGIMYKENKNSKLSFWQKRFNKIIAKTRWVVEQTFGTMKRKFNFERASYFTSDKVTSQFIMKSICINLLKAVNKVSLV